MWFRPKILIFLINSVVVVTPTQTNQLFYNREQLESLVWASFVLGFSSWLLRITLPKLVISYFFNQLNLIGVIGITRMGFFCSGLLIVASKDN